MIAHVVQFAVAALLASLVYHALRAEDLALALRTGFRRFLSCLVIAAAFGTGLQLLTWWL